MEDFMKILVINGSPKGEKSNTLNITKAFMDGLNTKKECEFETITIYQKNIDHCRGCYCCWAKTPGKCIINDDMEDIIEKYTGANIVIWSFPLYYYGMPSKTKAAMDRLLPNLLPNIIVDKDGKVRHPARKKTDSIKFILISTCGFCTIENNYEAVIKQFEIIYGNNISKILCPEGELFNVSPMEGRIKEYLTFVKKAGEEFMDIGFFSKETMEKINEPLYDPKEFIKMANSYWDNKNL
jgi:multimeric flavodoxin WrbA